MGPTHQIYLSILATLASVVCLATGCSSEEPEVGSGTGALLNPTPEAPSNPSAASAVIIESSTGEGYCSGTILSDGKLLTAAHCFNKSKSVQFEEVPLTERTGIRVRGAALGPANEDVFVVGYKADGGGKQGVVALAQFGDLSFPEFGFGVGNTSALEAVAANQHGAFAVGWEIVAGTTVARLYFFPAPVVSTDAGPEQSYGAPIPFDALLGAGTPSAVLSYEREGDTYLAVAINEGNAEGTQKARVVEIAIDRTTASVGLSIEGTILSERTMYRATSLASFATNSIAIGGIATTAIKSANVSVHTLQGDGTWANVAQSSGAGGATDVDLEAIDSNVAVLVKRQTSSADALYLWNPGVSGPLGANVFPSDGLKGHYEFSDSRTYARLDSLRGTSIASTIVGGQPKLYLSGTANKKSEPHSVVVRFESDLTVDATYAIRGVHVSSYRVTELAPIQAKGGTTYVPTWTVDQQGQAKGKLNIGKHGLPLQTIVGPEYVLSVQFAYGVDLALATLSNPLPNGLERSFAPTAVGMELNCIGQGGSKPASLSQGVFVVHQFTSPLDEYAEVTSTESSFTGGDSGGPCFDGEGQLAGVMVGAAAPSPPRRNATNNTIVTAQQLSLFVGEP